VPPLPRAGHAAALAACWLLACALGCRGPEPAVPPNLLLITVDTLRADRLTCYGGEPGVGEAICSLADGGSRFEWAISPAPYTAPAIASMLSSRYPGEHGVTQSVVSYLPRDLTTVAEVLEAAGYQTAAFVSNPVLDKGRSLDQGFQVYDQHMNRRERNRPRFLERDAESTTDAVLAWAQVAAREPWFVWVHFQDPHGPYEPPDADPGHDPPAAPPLAVLRDHSGFGGIPAYQALPGLFSAEAYEQRYREEIRYLDPHVKRLVEGLDSLGRPAGVLLTSDHGEAFGEDGYYFAHGHSLGLDQVRIPMLWRPPEPAQPAVESAPVSLVDVAPTLIQVAGLPVPPDFRGRPMPVAGLPRAPSQPGGRTLFAEHERRAAVIIGPTYYARDRSPIRDDEVDRTSGGRVRPLPGRTAQLEPPGLMPTYTVVGPDGGPAALESRLSAFLDATRENRGARHAELPDGAPEHLRALGYLE